MTTNIAVNIRNNLGFFVPIILPLIVLLLTVSQFTELAVLHKVADKTSILTTQVMSNSHQTSNDGEPKKNKNQQPVDSEEKEENKKSSEDKLEYILIHQLISPELFTLNWITNPSSHPPQLVVLEFPAPPPKRTTRT